MTISRRAFLFGSTAVVAATVLPAIPVAAPVSVVPRTIVYPPPRVAFIVGTPGEFDWQHIRAVTPYEAWEYWCYENDMIDEDDDGNEIVPDMDPGAVQRVPEWDGKKRVSNADWLRMDFGTLCERCGTEVGPHGDAIIQDDDRVICWCCETKKKEKSARLTMKAEVA